MKNILLALFVILVCSCNNYIPCVKEYSGDTKAINSKDSIDNNGNTSIIVDTDSSGRDFNYTINIPSK